ncbi:hypothetical protein Emed_005193 [Eimeria media]
MASNRLAWILVIDWEGSSSAAAAAGTAATTTAAAFAAAVDALLRCLLPLLRIAAQ